MKSLTPIILVLLSVAIFFFMIDPEYKEVQALQVEVAENEKTLEIAAQLSQKREELRKKYNLISQEDREKLEKLLPDTVDNVRLIIDIDNIAKKSGITIRDINISTEEGESENDAAERAPRLSSQGSSFEGVIEENSIGYVNPGKIGVITFSFSVSAKYEVFLDFLSQLEESLRIVDIRDINITRGSSDGSIYNYNVTMDTYWLK